MFDWDETKRLSNVAKHGLDFRLVPELFDGRNRTTALSRFPSEARFVTTVANDGILFTVIWTKREELHRVISFRRARREEEREYRRLFG